MKLTPTVAILAVLAVTCATADDATQATESKNPVRLETIISLATGPEGETPGQAKARAARFDREIDRLLALLSPASGRDLKSPVRMSGLPLVKAAETVNAGYVHVAPGQEVKSARNSIVVVERTAQAPDECQNCIVIVAGQTTQYWSATDSIVLGRYCLKMMHASQSVVLSEFYAGFLGTASRPSAIHCVCGGRAVGDHYSIQDSVYVNTKGRGGKQVKGLELTPAFDHALDGVIDVTTTINEQGGIALFRTKKDGKGEYVARFGLPVRDPNGRPIAALDGWRLDYAGYAGYKSSPEAVFAKDGRRAVLEDGRYAGR
jgi:hypothetical protein